jgi:hypothetical protein
VLQRSSIWLALPVAGLALIAMAGDKLPDTAPRELPAAGYTAGAGSAIRADVASRALMRTEVSLPITPLPEPAVEPGPPAPAVTEPEPVRSVPVAPPPPVVAVAARPSVAATCPINQFCYPRVGIAGTIVPYDDCTGATDVGTAIRSITCVSPTYLAAHAYTQFGRIAGWRVGDVVFAYGARYIVDGAFTQPGCAPPARAIAPLSLQTSLTPATCGPILVVQAHPG